MLTRRDLIAGGALAACSGLAARAVGTRKTPDMHRAATNFLASLDSDQRRRAQLAFGSDERSNWHYIPMARRGLPYEAMSPDQRDAARALLLSGLSSSGLSRVEGIRGLENVLHAIEGGNPIRNPEMYYFTVFGDPSPKGIWGWRYEGHHVSLQWTVVDGRVASDTPQFLGANPAEVRTGPQTGTRVLAAEEDLGRALVRSLTPLQRREAILSETAPHDIVTADLRIASLLEDRGVAYRRLNREQQGMLLAVLREFANVQIREIAVRRVRAISAAGLDDLKFAWMGGLERGVGSYYRIQGAGFVVEYDNTQNEANHVHVVWRDFKGDFGADLLALHYGAADASHGHDH